MKVLVTGSSGHLGEALVYTLRLQGYEVVGADITAGHYTTDVGSITDRSFVKRCMQGVAVVYHTATLHKPHVKTHSRQQFVDTNISGTLHLLEEAVSAGVRAFIFTSTTSTYGDALVPAAGAPAAWITEEVTPVPKNIYGVTKVAAENLCQLFYRNQGLPCIVLRTSRFFPEADDHKQMREHYADLNLKANEYLFRRVEISDAVQAHLLAADRAADIGFGTYIISATSPFQAGDTPALRHQAPAVVQRYVPAYLSLYETYDWKMFPSIDRVYVNEKARRELGWTPRYDFSFIVEQLEGGYGFGSPLAKKIGSKGYHSDTFTEGPYPV